MKLMDILTNAIPTIDFEREKNLVERGLLDSIGIVSIVVECSAAYDIEFPLDQLSQENFESYESIKKMVKALVEKN